LSIVGSTDVFAVARVDAADGGSRKLTDQPRHRTASIDLPSFDRVTLRHWIRAPTSPQRLALRSRIVLLLAEGISSREVARRLGISRHTVGLWRKRFIEGGAAALTRDRPGRGRKRRGNGSGSGQVNFRQFTRARQ
jgi:hypothetical protein